MNSTKPLVNNNLKIGIRQWLYIQLEIFNKSQKIKQLLAKIITAMLFGFFNGSFASYEQLIFKSYGCDALRYIVSRAKLPWEYFKDVYNRWAIRFIKKIAKKYGFQIYAIIDDMIEPKDKRSKNIIKGGKKGKIVGFSFVTCVLKAGFITIPLIPKIALRENVSRALGIKYISKVDHAIKFVDDLKENGLAEKKVIILLDSWYPSCEMLKAIKANGFIPIAAVKNNRKLNGFNIKRFADVIKKSEIKRLKSGEYTYHLAIRSGTLSGLKDRYNILLSKRTRKKDKKETWRYILCGDLSLSAYTILSNYQNRWVVETFHQIWQNRFAVGKWRLKGLNRLRNLIIITTMATGFAVFYANKILSNEQVFEMRKKNQNIIGVGLEIIRSILILKYGGCGLQP
jgi:hypothetical protein